MRDIRSIILAGACVGLLVACGAVEDQGVGDGGAAALVEEASFSAALSDGDGEDLGAVSTGIDLALAAEEDVESDLDDDGVFEIDCSLAALRERVIDEYDGNGDGRLGADELHELREELGPRPLRRHCFARHHRLARLRWIYDGDDSGRLDEAERAELRADLEQRCENREAWLLASYDADGSGDLDAEEWAQAIEDLRARRRARRAAILEEFDLNGDGWLGPFERLAALHARVEAIQERRQALFDTYDVDDDGVLDADEKAALREALKSLVRGEYFVDGDLDEPLGGDPAVD